MEVISRKEAIAEGLNRYYTGRPCKRGHISERRIDGWCIKCRNEFDKRNEEAKRIKNREFYLKNKEIIKTRVKEWAKKNPKRRKEISLSWAKNNPDKARKIQNDFRMSNPERSKSIKRSWIERNPEKQKAARRNWRKENNGHVAFLTRKRQAQQLNATPQWLTQGHLDQMAAIYREAAERSERDGIKYHVDHQVPLLGKNVSGLHVPWNLQILEASENISKSNKLTL